MIRFFQQFLGARMHVGAIAPSGPFLAKRIIREAGVSEARTILELGSGTGAFTGKILEDKAADARFLAVERSEEFGRILRDKFRGLDLIVADAQTVDFSHWLNGEGGFDSVVSGLPWAAFPEGLQREIISHVRPFLKQGATFTTFAYFGPHLLAAGRKFRKLLHEQFQNVRMSQVELLNFPPAFVYVAEAN